MKMNIQLFGGRGASSSGSSSGTSSGNSSGSYKSDPEYKSEYSYEYNSRKGEVAVPGAMPSENRSDSVVETQMISYASAVGDPIRAMERQRDSVERARTDYLDAKSPMDKGVRDAMTQIIGEYEQAISRMKRIKSNSRYKDMM